jgi:hypothetical protein
MSQFTATADGKGLTATAQSGAAAGSYAVNVQNIATSQSITSGAFKSTDTLGTGSMTLNVNGKTSTIKIDSSNNTISGIAQAINSASDNPGVTATIVNGTDGALLGDGARDRHKHHSRCRRHELAAQQARGEIRDGGGEHRVGSERFDKDHHHARAHDDRQHKRLDAEHGGPGREPDDCGHGGVEP